MADLDLARIKRNVTKMAAQGAPVEDIDGYIASEGTSVDAIRAFRPVQPAPAAPSQPAASPEATGGNIPAAGATALGAADTASFGFGGELGAALGAASEYLGSKITGAPARSYTELRDAMRDQDKRAQDQHPGYYLGGQVAGGFALPAGGGARTLPTVLAEGAVGGGAYGFGSGEGGFRQRVENVPVAAVAGAGGAAVARTVGNAVTKAAARRTIPGTEALEDASNTLYDAADAANVALQPKTVQKMIGNAQIAAGRLDDSVRPHTAGIVRDFQAKMGQPMGLREFDDLRKSVGLAMDGARNEDLRPLTIIKQQMDNLADNLTPSDISGGIDGVGHLSEARRLWSMKSKAEDVAKMVSDAETKSAGRGNFENTLRDQFKALATNEGRMKRFTDAERSAIMKVARGGPLVNTLRVLAKFAPDSPLLLGVGVLGAAVGSGGTAAIGVPLAGMGAKAAAGGITRGNVRALDEVIRSGGQTVGDIIQQGRLGQGPGVMAVERGQPLSDLLRLPLAVGAAEAEAYRRR